MRILVADDNRDAADALVILLRMAGHEVDVAHDGRTAFAIAESFRPRVALLDIGMPELDGYGLARGIREQPWGRAIRLVAITALGTPQDRRRVREAGFDEHLTKPLELKILEELLLNLGTVADEGQEHG